MINMDSKVIFNNVSLEENNFTILNDLNFSIESQKIIGLIGRNGAGKTSLLSLLASYRYTANGEILIDGEEAFENAEKMEQVIFIYPKDLSEEDDTVQDTMELFNRYYPNYDSEYASYLISRFKLPLDKVVSELSKGMQSAMNVAIGLASKAPITIFDEAYLSMDAATREIFYEELQDSQINDPRLFIISTHIISETEYLFDEVMILDHGEVLFFEDYESLISKGLTITGLADEVDQLVTSYNQVHEKRLGNIKEVTIFGKNIESLRENAAGANVEIGPIALQQLFNHLTEGSEINE